MTKTILRRSVEIQEHDLQGLSPMLQKILLHRGIYQTSQIEHELKALLPFEKLKNIEKSSALLYQHLKNQNNMMIIGDFDADGATSTAVAVSALKKMGAKHVEFLVPNRFEYGYGLTPEIVEEAYKKNPALIITVDNGISSFDGVEKAKALGIDVLITDHHLSGQRLPNADVIINPNQPDDEFASKCIAGVGVIFYVMLAFRKYLRDKDWFNQQKIQEPNLADLLDLVALGTIADVVSLDQNNRIFVHQGLKRIRHQHGRPGIQALIKIANRQAEHLVAQDLAFAIGPRLNAAGRLDDMSLGIHCLLSDSMPECLHMAQILNELNHERRSIEQDMQQQAQQILKKINFESYIPSAICLYHPDWHQGVIGILAGRLKEFYHRPTFAFASGNPGEIKGSARSIPGLHIKDLLENIAIEHPNLMTKFGGHAMAAGLTIPLENFTNFKKIIEMYCERQLTKEQLEQNIFSDGELTKEDFNLSFATQLREIAPWGQSFPEPLFDGEFELLDQRLVGEKHLKMSLKMNDKFINAIAFNVDLSSWPDHRCQKIYIAYKLDVNFFRGVSQIQLLIEHLEKR